jgi:hypothetical protein
MGRAKGDREREEKEGWAIPESGGSGRCGKLPAERAQVVCWRDRGRRARADGSNVPVHWLGMRSGRQSNALGCGTPASDARVAWPMESESSTPDISAPSASFPSSDVPPHVLQHLRSMSLSPPLRSSTSSSDESYTVSSAQSSEPPSLGLPSQSPHDELPIWHRLDVSKHLRDLLDRYYYHRGVSDCRFIDTATLEMLDSTVRALMHRLHTLFASRTCGSMDHLDLPDVVSGHPAVLL